MTLYEQLLADIIKEFEIKNENNIKIVYQSKLGFSGAEVYAIELKAPSKYTGYYFLKIDKCDNEFSRHKIAKKFSFAAKYIQLAKINNYYVLLTQTAGNSGIDFKCFIDIPILETTELISKIINNNLSESLDKKSFSPNRMSFNEICSKLLLNKLSDNGPIITMLNKHLLDPFVLAFCFGEYEFPNALYYAKKTEPDLNAYYLSVPVHGDFHVGNVFLCPRRKAYAVIDWALASQDGLLFYDNAYFEFSLLLHAGKDMALEKWIETVIYICEENWAKLSFMSKEQIRIIHETENEWINQVNDDCFSHVDKMKVAQIMARVIVGLNYAGKKRIDDSSREMAFLFSCIYLLDSEKFYSALIGALPPSSVELHRGKWSPIWSVSQEKEYSSPR